MANAIGMPNDFYMGELEETENENKFSDANGVPNKIEPLKMPRKQAKIYLTRQALKAFKRTVRRKVRDKKYDAFNLKNQVELQNY